MDLDLDLDPHPKKTLDLDCDLDRHQNLIDCYLGHGPVWVSGPMYVIIVE